LVVWTTTDDALVDIFPQAPTYSTLLYVYTRYWEKDHMFISSMATVLSPSVLFVIPYYSSAVSPSHPHLPPIAATAAAAAAHDSSALGAGVATSVQNDKPRARKLPRGVYVSIERRTWQARTSAMRHHVLDSSSRARMVLTRLPRHSWPWVGIS
jgi:hypothetical protein